MPTPETALITGASGGIGAELARIHAERQGNLVLVARRRALLEALKAELEERHRVSVLVLAEDLSDEAAPQRIYDQVRAAGIEVTCLINNAGFGGLGRFDTRDWKADRAMMQVNMVALTALTRLFLPDFLARNNGRILNISSSAALTPGPMQAVYYASKAYVTSFSNALAAELYDTPVTVTALMPGPVDTDFARTSHMEETGLFQGAFPPREIAAAGYAAMLRGDLNVICGMRFMQRQLLRLLPLMPKWPVLKMIRRMQSV